MSRATFFNYKKYADILILRPFIERASRALETRQKKETKNVIDRKSR